LNKNFLQCPVPYISGIFIVDSEIAEMRDKMIEDIQERRN